MRVIIILLSLILLVLVGVPIFQVAVTLLGGMVGGIILLVKEIWILIAIAILIGFVFITLAAIRDLNGDEEQLKQLNLQIRARENKRRTLEDKRRTLEHKWNVETSVSELADIERNIKTSVSELADVERDIKNLREARDSIELKLDQKRQKADASG